MRTTPPRSVIFAISLAACGGGASRPCTVQLTGGLTRTDTCTSKNHKAMALKTASDLNWLAQFDDDTILTNITFQLPKPVTVTTYTGGPDVPWCTATVTLKGGLSRNANSRPSVATGMVLGSCSITLTSAVEDSSGSTVSYVVAGTARATVVNPAATPSSVDVTIDF